MNDRTRADGLRIAANDPRGARAVVGGQMTALGRACEEILWDLANESIREGCERIERLYKGCIVSEWVKHETGSRAYATWLILDPQGEDRLELFELVYDVRRRHGKDTPWHASSLGILVSKHVLDRCAQRTVHRGELQHVVPAIHQHVRYATVLSSQEYFIAGSEIQTVNVDGAVLWRCDDTYQGLRLIACTWLDGESLKDPEIRHMVREANEFHGRVLCRRGKLNKPPV